MDDTGARPPEADAVLASAGLEEVEDLGVGGAGAGQVCGLAVLADDEVVAVDGGGDAGVGEPRGHELEHGHLRGGVLHGDAVRGELEVVPAADVGERGAGGEGLLGVGQVGVEDLLGEGEWLVACDAVDALEVLEQLGVGGHAGLELGRDAGDLGEAREGAPGDAGGQHNERNERASEASERVSGRESIDCAVNQTTTMLCYARRAMVWCNTYKREDKSE